ncbi:chloride channel protein [Mariprofundus aestuarium]|nr:chloride channel protein [Mariprofundus aestuarium]
MEKFNMKELLERSWLREKETVYLVLLAVVVGVVSGYASLLLRFAIEWVSLFWTGERTWLKAMETLPWYIYLVAPTVGGLLVGWITVRYLPGGELRGVSGVLADMVEHKARVHRHQMATETFGSAIAIGSGASLGREGPTVALGALIASEIGQRAGLSEQQLRILIGCGVAAAIAASFNTPIAGVLFALEVILADYAIATFSPIVIASVLATAIARSEVGNFPAFTVPEYHLISVWEIPAYMLMGVLCGIVASGFIKSMAPTRAWLARILPNRRLRPAAVGFVIGLMGLAIPQVMSIGYGFVEDMMLERINPELVGIVLPLSAFLAIVLIAKMIAVVLSAAGGFPGGLFGPALFLGATVGALFGDIAHAISPSYSESYGAYALVACGALTAAALQAPLTVMLIVFEMTADYHIMLPLMIACSVATMAARSFGRASVFTESLEERGIETHWGREQSWMRSVPITRIPWRSIPRVSEHAKLEELKQVYTGSGKGCVQVVDDDGDMVGIVTFGDLQEWLIDPALDQVVVASEVANRNVLTVRESDSLLDAIHILDSAEFEQMPVVSDDNSRKVLGILSRNAIFSTYHKLIVKHGERDHE